MTYAEQYAAIIQAGKCGKCRKDNDRVKEDKATCSSCANRSALDHKARKERGVCIQWGCKEPIIAGGRCARHAAEHGARNRGHGVSEDLYQEAFSHQCGKCAVCRTDTAGGSTKRNRFACDHNEETKTFRGLLCFQDNASLGSKNDAWERQVDRAAYAFARDYRGESWRYDHDHIAYAVKQFLIDTFGTRAANDNATPGAREMTLAERFGVAS
jgi:hypothetical protein